MTTPDLKLPPTETSAPPPRTTNVATDVEVEVAHEALVRHWERLQNWLGEDRVGLRLRQEISDAAQRWAAHDRNRDYLAHHGSRLTEVEALQRVGRLSLNAVEASYVDACIAVREQDIAEQQAKRDLELKLAQESARNEESRRLAAEQAAAIQRRSARRLRWLSIVLAASVVLASSLAWYARDQQQDARRQAQVAQALGLSASSGDLANGGIEDELAALLGVEAAERGANLGLDAEIGTALQASIGAPYFSRLIESENTSSVVSLAFNPSGANAAVGKFDGTVTLVDLSTAPTAEQTLTPAFVTSKSTGDQWVSSVAFSPDGQYLAASAYHGGIQIWSMASGSPVAVGSPLHLPRAVYSVSFGDSPTQGIFLLASACAEETCANDRLTDSAYADDSGNIGSVVVTRWFASADFDASSAVSFELPGNRLYATAISSKGTWLAAGGCKRFPRPPSLEPHSGNDCQAGFLYLLDLEQSEATPVSFESGAGAILAVAFEPGAATLPKLAAAGEDRIIRIWQSTNSQLPQQPLATLIGHDEEIRSLSFSPTDSLLVSSGHDGTISLWSLTDPHSVVELLGISTEWVRALAFDATGERMLSAAGNGRIRVWEMESDDSLSEPGVLRGHTSFIRAIVFGPDPGQPMVISAAEDGTVRIWQFSEGRASVRKVVVRPGSTTLRVSDLSISSDGSILAITDERGGVWRLNLVDSSAVPFLIGTHRSGPLHVAFDPNHSIVAVGGVSGQVQLWNATASEPTRIGSSFGDEGSPIWTIAYSRDGTVLAAGGGDGTIRRWRMSDDGRSAEALSSFTLEGVTIRSLAFGPGNELVTGGSDGNLCFWGSSEPPDLRTCPNALHAHTGDVRSLEFNPDGSQLASGGIDQTLRIWNPDELDASPVVIPTIMEWVRAIAFAPNGQTIAVSSNQGSIRLILPYASQLVERACAQVSRDMTQDEWDQYMQGESKDPTCGEIRTASEGSVGRFPPAVARSESSPRTRRNGRHKRQARPVT